MTGELPPGWEWTTVGAVADTQLGKTLSTKPVGGGRLKPYLRNKNVQWFRVDVDDLKETYFTGEEEFKYQLEPGDLLVCEGGEVGRCAIWQHRTDELHFQNALHRVRTSDGVRPGWLQYALRWSADTGRLASHTSGVTINHLVQRALRKIEIPLPPTNEQERIVAAIEEHFSRLDAAYSALKTGKLRSAHLMECALQAGIRQYPTQESSLASFLTQKLSNGRSVPTANGDGFPVLRLTCLQSGLVNTNETKLGDFSGADHKKYQIEPDDFLISRGNGSIRLVGIGGLVNANAPPVAFPDTLIRARVDRRRLRPEFLRLIWNSKLVRRQMEAQARTTAGIYKVNQTMIGKVSFPTPSPEDQDHLVQSMDQVREVVARLDARVSLAQERSKSLRRSILVDAFLGRLVPQDPKDEPASALLDRIAASRQPA